MRIQNYEQITSHGNQTGRKFALDILEAGLTAADPYQNAGKLFRREGTTLYVGNPDFEGDGDPNAGVQVYDLLELEHIYVVGAGKGVQRVVKAIEEVLGDFLTDGELICKYGDQPILSKVRVTYAAHPLPDQNCILGAQRIKALAGHVTKKDLVITVFANGGSSLLTYPYEGISLEDVQSIVQTLQIKKGVSTIELNKVRNHIDQMKGGRLSDLFRVAQLIHIIVTDANHHVTQLPRHDYNYLMKHNVWLHNLPEGSTFADARDVLARYDAWDACPQSIRDFLTLAPEDCETIKYEQFLKTRFRVFGIMPDKDCFLLAARSKAEQIGLQAAILSETFHAESAPAGNMLASIARNIAENNEPLQAPVALLSTGEFLVSTKNGGGIGGRNQEMVLSAARILSGCDSIVIASVDTDGTDGPGGLKLEGAPKCLGGGIVDGYTAEEARAKNIDLEKALSSHSTSAPLWMLNNGIVIEQNISLNDLTVILVLPAHK